MRRLWRSVQRQPALYAAAVLVVINIIALSGVLHLSGAAIGGINAGIAAVLAFLVGLVTSWQLSHVRRRYIVTARDAPGSVVPTAGSWMSDVVGRDDLCRAIIEGIRDPAIRRPQVVIGGEGAGKTAVLVRLTKLLAYGDKIPLRVRIKDALRRQGLRTSTTEMVPVPVRLSDAQEGLDFNELARIQFLANTDAALLSAADGEKVWRQLRQDDKIVVLADSLEETLIEGSSAEDRDDLIRLAVRRANVQRLPLIVASRPHAVPRGLDAAIVELEQLSDEAAFQYVLYPGPNEDEYRLEWILETASIPRSPFYLQIARQLNMAQLIQRPASRSGGPRLDTRGVDRSELRLRLLQTWEQALVRGLFLPGVELSYFDRVATVEHLSVLACIGLRQDRRQVKLDEFGTLLENGQPERPIIREAAKRLGAILHSSFDVQLAAAWGTQLQIVEAEGSTVRFSHSVLQAYLGSRLIGHAMADHDFSADALRNPGPELFNALVMYSRTTASQADLRKITNAGIGSDGAPAEPIDLCKLLRAAAAKRKDAKALDIYAAMLEIDSVDPAPNHQAIASEIAAKWPELVARNIRELEYAKLNLIGQFGEAARVMTQRRVRTHYRATDPARPAYRQLFDISCREFSHPIRLAAAQEIGIGGDDALDALVPVLGPDEQDKGEMSSTRAEWRFEEDEERRHRQLIISAWLVPLLVGSAASSESRRTAHGLLERWMEFVQAQHRRPGSMRFGLSLEVALAQGFKYAANRRDTDPLEVNYLVGQAREILKITPFWFSRITLIHALCLASLRDSTDRQRADRGKHHDYRELVAFWLGSPDSRSLHPFVAEACWLAARALETRQPERYIWIDETTVASHVGSHTAMPGPWRRHSLWIPPYTGWAILHPRAQQLVADTILLLNLAEQGQPGDRDRGLRRTDRNDLPPCLARDPSPLNPTRSIGAGGIWQPGTTCRQACPFEFCPYPPKGTFRTELSVAFCRRQQALVSGIRGGNSTAAPWRGASPADLRRFWKQMSQRG